MALVEPGLLLQVRVATADTVIRITDSTPTAEDMTITSAVSTDYWNSGDDDATAGDADFLKIIKDGLDANGLGLTFTVTPDSRNIIRIQSSGGTSNILWSHGNTTFDPTLIGFTSADTGLGTTHTSPDTSKGWWYPGTTSNSRHVWEDTRNEPVTVGHLAETIDGQSRGYELASSLGERNIAFHLLAREKILTEYAAADEPFGSLEYCWKTLDQNIASGAPLRWYNDRTSRTTSSYGKYRTKTRDRPWQKMDVSALNRYEVFFSFRERS